MFFMQNSAPNCGFFENPRDGARTWSADSSDKKPLSIAERGSITGMMIAYSMSGFARRLHLQAEVAQVCIHVRLAPEITAHEVHAVLRSAAG